LIRPANDELKVRAYEICLTLQRIKLKVEGEGHSLEEKKSEEEVQIPNHLMKAAASRVL
jgi:hypothetical protein